MDSSLKKKYGSISETGPNPHEQDPEMVEVISKEAVSHRQFAIAVTVFVSSMSLACLSTVSVQVLGGAIPEFELNAWRFLAQVVVVLPVVLYRRCDLRIPKKKLLLSIAMFIAYNLFNMVFYTAQIYLAVGTANGLYSSILIIFNVVLSICIKDSRKVELYAGAFLAVTGLMLMTQPDFLFPNDPLGPPPTTNFTSPCALETNVFVNYDNQWIGYVCIVIASGLSCSTYYGMHNIVRELGVFTFSFWNAFVGTCVSLVLMAIFEAPVIPTSPLCMFLLLSHAIGTSQISIILPWCLKYISPTVCCLLNALQLVLLLVLQYTALSDIQPGNRNWLEILGGCIVFLGIITAPVYYLCKGRCEKKNRM